VNAASYEIANRVSLAQPDEWTLKYYDEGQKDLLANAGTPRLARRLFTSRKELPTESNQSN
jgi:hypothetical protein